MDTVVICCAVNLTLPTTRIPECAVRGMVQGKDGWTQKKGEMDRDAMVRVLAETEVA